MNSRDKDALDRLLEAVPEPAHDAAAAAMTSYSHSPSDDLAAVQAVQQAMECSTADAEAFIARYGTLIRAAADEYAAKMRQFGAEGPELAALEAQKAHRAADLDFRISAYHREVAALVPEGKTVGEAVTPEQLDALVRKHGLAPGPDGQLILASDVND